jgi:hypothetical protein
VYECNLASGDKIQVGNATLIFEIDGVSGDGLLRQVPAMTTAPRQIIFPGSSTGSHDGLRPSESKMTIPVHIPPPPPSAK